MAEVVATSILNLIDGPSETKKGHMSIYIRESTLEKREVFRKNERNNQYAESCVVSRLKGISL